MSASLPVPSISSATEKTLARIRAGLSLALLDAERFQSLMDSNSGDLEELRSIALSLAKDIDFVEEKAKTLDPNDPTLIIPREVVNSLASQATTGESIMSEWLQSRKETAIQAITLGVSQGTPLGQMADTIESMIRQ